MQGQGNEMMKRFLQQIVNSLLRTKSFEDISKVEVFFAFGSKHKTAMCDYVYGLRIHSDIPMTMRPSLGSDLIQKIKGNVERTMNKSVCCTDVIWVKNYE